MGSSLSVVHPEHGFVRVMKCSPSVNPECGLGDGRGEADNGASAMRKMGPERGMGSSLSVVHPEHGFVRGMKCSLSVNPECGMSDGRGGSQMRAR